MKTKEWLAFIGLSLAWGTSFLWIKIALDEIGPFTLVAFRLLFGLLGLLAVIAVMRPAWPNNRRSYVVLAVMGLTNVALPFTLISWGEVFIDSAVASILNSTVPLFTALIAHFVLEGERLDFRRVGGVLLGFIGVVTLMFRGLSANGLEVNLLGQGAVLLASIFYAFSSIFARKNPRGGNPVTQSLVQVFVADALLWAAVPVVESPFTLPTLPITWLALAWLGLIGSCIAYLLYFYLLDSAGPTKMVMITYTFPVTGIILGWLFLNEAINWELFLGGALVLASIVIVNRKA
jgi:drug/metabolite transporter (DMT)-like permease